MKRTSVILVMSGIVIAIYFFSTNSNESAGFSKYVSKKKTKKISKSSPIDISRQIAAQNNSKLKISPTKEIIKLDSRESAPSASFDFNEVAFTDDETIKVIDSLYVVQKEDFVPDSYKVIDKRSTFYIVESEYPVGDTTLAVVAVKGSKYLGVVTGILKVELNNFSERDTILSGHDYEIHTEFEHLNIVFYKLDGYEQAKAAYEAVKDLVPYADLEILQYERSER